MYLVCALVIVKVVCWWVETSAWIGGWKAVANDGHIELGGLTGKAGSKIEIQSNNDKFSLRFPDGVQRGDGCCSITKLLLVFPVTVVEVELL